MNILIPDSWLRKFLTTKATPSQIKEYLSLCGPSVERIHEESGEPVYDIEITTNRPDAMSIVGVAREASVILPQFGIDAELLENPYDNKSKVESRKSKVIKPLRITTDPELNPRWTSIVMDQVQVKESPEWLRDWLTKTGIRPINTIVDVTNYLMRAYGQPAHAFDYDRIGKKNGIPTMKLRASKKGETLTTLDGITHVLPGDDIVITDGTGKLIDLCGIMGGENSSIQNSTKTIILFLQTYDPVHIRKTSMSLAHRTEAAGLFEKGVDSELVYPAILKGIELIKEIAGGFVASELFDLYPKPFTPYTVTVNRSKVDRYIGTSLADKELFKILGGLGFRPSVTKNTIAVTVPSWRRDITIDVDIIEEVARIWGYHRITNRLPDGEPPVTILDKTLFWEEEIKVRLRDWGFTEMYTYSMISEAQMDNFELDKKKAYKIANPLTEDWAYMRPSLTPSFLAVIKENLTHRENLRVFELSKVYRWRESDLPEEADMLIVGLTGNKFFEAKGVGEAICELFGITSDPQHYGSITIIEGITLLELSVNDLVADAKPGRKYTPIPKYPPIVEDLTFIVPDRFEIGPLLKALQTAHPLLANVSLLDVYENTRTLHIIYQDTNKNLTSEEIAPIRNALITLAKNSFNAVIKSL